MIKTRKIIAAVAITAVTTLSVFAKDSSSGPDFTNRVYSDITIIDTNSDSNNTTFAGIYDLTSVELRSGKVDAGLAITAAVGKGTEISGWNFSLSNGITVSYKDYYGVFGYTINDFYIEYRPIDMITIGWSDVINCYGGYLPISGTYVSNANMGSDICAVFRPVSGLRICGGFDMPSYFGTDTQSPDINVGIDYTNNTLSLGASVRNLVGGEGNIAVGFYGTYSGFKGLSLSAGYSINSETPCGVMMSNYSAMKTTPTTNKKPVAGVYGNIMNIAAVYNTGSFTLTGEIATNFGQDAESAYDFYGAAQGTFNFTKNFKASLTGSFLLDFEDSEDGNGDGDVYQKSIIQIVPGVTFTSGIHEFGVAVKFNITDRTYISFPVYYQISL